MRRRRPSFLACAECSRPATLAEWADRPGGGADRCPGCHGTGMRCSVCGAPPAYYDAEGKLAGGCPHGAGA